MASSEGVHPTRMELLDVQKKTALAKKGHKLLKEKRDALLMELFELVEKARGVRTGLAAEMDVGYSNLIEAGALMGRGEVESIAMGMPESIRVDVTVENLMGVVIPKVTIERLAQHGGTYQIFSSGMLDRSMESWSRVVDQLLILAEYEESVRQLAHEIKKTKRRVNALEYILLPKLESTQKYIRMRLEEMQRENFFRLKTVKKMKMREPS